jgi:hypothetical protein
MTLQLFAHPFSFWRGAAPVLFHADRSHPLPEHLAALKGYRARPIARPFFPLGAPDRDGIAGERA